MTDSKPKPAARRKARRFVLQALYQIQMTGDPATTVEAQFRQDNDMKNVDTLYFHEMLVAIDADAELVEIIKAKLDRDYAELDPIERCILRLGAKELKDRIDIPFKVVINECVELAKQFGGSESHKLVNSVLDALAKELRIAEYRVQPG